MQETIVRLKVLSLVDTPDEITAALGLCCDNSWRVGDARERTVILEKENGWVRGSGLPESAPLEDHVEALLSVLDSRADLLRTLSASATVEFSCVIYADSPPALNFEKEVIERLARLGAGLDIDLYIVECDAPR